MELEIKNEEELEEIAVRIGQLKDALPGSQEAAALTAMMQAMVTYVKRNAIKPDRTLLQPPGWNKRSRLLEFPRRKVYPPDQIHIDTIALAWHQAG